MTTFGIAITVIAVALFGAFVLLGAWIDGRRQKVLEAGKHPITTDQGTVVAEEELGRRTQE